MTADGRTEVQDAYGGAFYSLRMARVEGADPMRRLDWLIAALTWRSLARILRNDRRNGR